MAGPYYVDATNGDDANAGTAIGTPKQTIADVLADYVLAAGDVIWLAPGKYRQSSTLSMEASGSSGSPIIFKGDPNLSQTGWPAATVPGVVNITRSDANNVPTSGILVDHITYDYIEWWDIVFDGVQGITYATIDGGGSSATHNYLRRCIVLGGYIAVSNYFECVDSVLFGVTSGTTVGVNTTRCVVIGTNLGASTGTHNCSIGICCANGAFVDGATKNCTALFSTYGRYNAAASGDENLYMLGTYYGLRNASTTNVFTGSVMGLTRIDGYSDTYNMTASRLLYYTTKTLVTNPAGAGHCHLLWPSATELIRAFALIARPYGWDDEDLAEGSGYTSETKDILGMDWGTRFDGETTTRHPMGAVSLSDVRYSKDATNGNTIQILKLGQELLRVPLKRATATSVNIKCVCALGGGSTYPQVELIPPTTAYAGAAITDTATGTTEETLTVSVDADDILHDCVATLLLKSRETGTGAYATFYGLTVT